MRKAFKIGYLMGLSEAVLQREYPTEYRESMDLKSFKNYKEVEVVRSLSKARQNIIRYNHLYTKGRSVSDVAKQGMKAEIEYLKKLGLDLDKVLEVYGQRVYINIVTKIIDERVEEALESLSVPMPELIKVLFEFKIFETDIEYKDFVETHRKAVKPHGVVVYGWERIEGTISYMFNKNFNIYATAVSLKQDRTPIYEKALEQNDFKWKKTGVGKDRDINLKEVLSSLEEKQVKEVIVVDKTPQEEIDKCKKGQMEVYVDTRGKDKYKLLTYLRQIREQIEKVVIYVEEGEGRTYEGMLERVVGLERCKCKVVEDTWSTKKDIKREVSIVSEVVEGYYTRGMRRAFIVTNNRDIEGLMRVRPEITYLIGVEKEQIDTKYKKYLTEKRVDIVELSEVDGSVAREILKEYTVEEILLGVLKEYPVKEWDVFKISEAIEKQESIKNLGIDGADILGVVEEALKSVRVKVDGSKQEIEIIK